MLEGKYYLLQKLLDENGTNNNQLAKAIGINKSILSRWRNGYSSPSLGTLCKIAEYFKVPLSYFTDSNG